MLPLLPSRWLPSPTPVPIHPPNTNLDPVISLLRNLLIPKLESADVQLPKIVPLLLSLVPCLKTSPALESQGLLNLTELLVVPVTGHPLSSDRFHMPWFLL